MEWGVYVHLPWCRKRCPYCAFVVDVRVDRPHAAYTAAVQREWARQGGRYEGAPSTVYFGGGTPSLAPPAEIARLIDTFRPVANAEVTLEVNPGDLGDAAAERMAAWRDAGVNRLSLGVQSFLPETARRLGRGHDPRDAWALVEQARRAGFRSVSFDLIFGVPGQDLAGWVADLDAAVRLDPGHVSLYGLTIHPGTTFAKRGVAPPDDDLWRALYDVAVERLEAAGLDRYEVANFARPGHRARHNEHYWRGRPWLGLGVGAHGWWPDGTRTVNVDAVDAYLAAADPLATAARPTPEELAAELIGSTLRHVDGLDRAQLRAWTGLDVEVPASLRNETVLIVDADHLRLGREGFPLIDAVARRLCATLHPVGCEGAGPR